MGSTGQCFRGETHSLSLMCEEARRVLDQPDQPDSAKTHRLFLIDICCLHNNEKYINNDKRSTRYFQAGNVPCEIHHFMKFIILAL